MPRRNEPQDATKTPKVEGVKIVNSDPETRKAYYRAYRKRYYQLHRAEILTRTAEYHRNNRDVRALKQRIRRERKLEAKLVEDLVYVVISDTRGLIGIYKARETAFEALSREQRYIPVSQCEVQEWDLDFGRAGHDALVYEVLMPPTKLADITTSCR